VGHVIKYDLQPMKTLILFTAFVLSTASDRACAQIKIPVCTWAGAADNSGVATTNGVGRDGDESTVLIGSYNGVLTFDTAQISSQGSSSAFLAKYGKSNKLNWVSNMTGTGIITGVKSVCDKTGSIYAAGLFTQSLLLSSYTLTSNGGRDIFLIKYRPDGTVAWAKSYGTSTDDEFFGALAVDNNADIVLAGAFSSSSAIAFDTMHRYSNGGYDDFWAKIDSSGVCLWCKTAGDQGSDRVTDVAVDNDGNIFIVGGFNYNVRLDTVELESATLFFSTADVFLAKCAADGSVLWARPIGGYKPNPSSSGGLVIGRQVATDSLGSAIVGGDYNNCSLSINGMPYAPDSYTTGQYDIWFAKYDAFGSLQWVRTARGSGNDLLRDIGTDKANNIYLTGFHGHDCVFGNDTAFLPATNPIGENLFLCSYSAMGQERWLRTADGQDNSRGNGLCVDGVDNVWAVGEFAGSILSLDSNTVSNNSSRNGFVAQFELLQSAGVETRKNEYTKVFPNPARGYLFIEQKRIGQFWRFALSDIYGGVVCEGRIEDSREVKIKLPELSSGFYVLRLLGDEEQVSHLISVE
jgi:hypothetical protein